MPGKKHCDSDSSLPFSIQVNCNGNGGCGDASAEESSNFCQCKKKCSDSFIPFWPAPKVASNGACNITVVISDCKKPKKGKCEKKDKCGKKREVCKKVVTKKFFDSSC